MRRTYPTARERLLRLAPPSCTDVSCARTTRPAVEQEVGSAHLYQVLRRTMVQAAESQPGTDPDRCSFTVALQTARDLLVGAEGVFEQGIGEIGRRVLSALSPARRGRVSTRKVKSPSPATRKGNWTAAPTPASP